MAWLTPEQFETAVRIERTEGSAGFGGLLAAATYAHGGQEMVPLISSLWFGYLGAWHYADGWQIAHANYDRFIVFFAAAALHADLENQRRIEQICPGLNEELEIRFNTAGSLLPGERRTMDGKLYECIEIEVYRGKEVQVKRKVVEVSA